MLEVRELRLQPAQQPRQRPGHAKLLRPRGHLDRLDAVGYELRTPGHGSEGQVGRHLRQLPQQIEDIRLLAGAVAAEYIGVQHDHATAS